MVDLIVECTIDDHDQQLIGTIGQVKYALPMINAYVVSVHQDKVHLLVGIAGVKQVSHSAQVTAQMNVAKEVIGLSDQTGDTPQGEGVTIAFLDTGLCPIQDFTAPRNRILAFKDFVGAKREPYDDNGHGTHVTGIAAGNGFFSEGCYKGIAPKSNIVSVKVLGTDGSGSSGDVLAGLQWVMDNRQTYNIRVVNLSVGTQDISTRDPLVRAVEAAWDAGLVVIVAAGNNGPMASTITSPGVSRKVITVGASDDYHSVQIWGDTLENYSGRGPTADCIIKPDVIAPGANIVSCLTGTLPIGKRESTKTKIVAAHYIQMSGTSMSTPMVSGAIALLLEKKPHMSPNEVKLLLKKTSVSLQYPPNQQGWGLLNITNLLS